MVNIYSISLEIRLRKLDACVAQLVEHIVANDKVVGSRPTTRSSLALVAQLDRASVF